MRRLFFLATLTVFLVGLVLLDLCGTGISIADTGVPSNEVTTNVTGVGNSSASATITITMTGILNE